MWKCIGVSDTSYTWKKLVSEDSGENVNQMEPADGDTPLVFFTGVKPTTKDNVLAEMVYTSKGKVIRAYVKIKCQGSSSMGYAKKNFTVTLYQDEARTIPLELDLKDWGIKVSKFVLKADWIDHSHARNVCTGRIWNDIVESRPDYDTLPEELKGAPGHGAIVGFPIAVYYNGNYEGIYNWNIGKDPWMWGMDENNPNHAMLCAEVNNEKTGNATVCNFRGPLWGGVDGSGWSVEIGTNSTALKNSLNTLIQFVANSDEETFVNGIEEYLDVQSAMDYYCLCYADCGLDGLGKNMTIGTYDGKRWYFGAYDLDCTWLLYWNGSQFVPATYRCPEDYQENANLLFDKFERFMTARLKANYQRLRSGPLSVANIMQHFERYIGEIGQERYADDLVSYPGIPQAANNNIRQIRNAVRDRLAYTDGEFTAMKPPVPATGITLSVSTMTFDSHDNQTLIATVVPADSTDIVMWESSDTGVAVVADGVVTPIARGTATITATAGSVSATCQVAVNVDQFVTHAITRNLTNCVSSSAVGVVNDGYSHTETITAADGYTMDGATVSVTMSSEDISAMYANGILSIESVSGDIVITAAAVKIGLDVPLIPFKNGTHTFSDGTTATITNGNHVKIVSGATAIQGGFLSLSDVTSNTSNVSGTDNVKAQVISVDFSDATVEKFNTTAPDGLTQGMTLLYADKAGITRNLLNNHLVNEDKSTTNSNANGAVNIGMWYGLSANTTVEFDVRIIGADGQRYV